MAFNIVTTAKTSNLTVTPGFWCVTASSMAQHRPQSQFQMDHVHFEIFLLMLLVFPTLSLESAYPMHMIFYSFHRYPPLSKVPSVSGCTYYKEHNSFLSFQHTVFRFPCTLGAMFPLFSSRFLGIKLGGISFLMCRTVLNVIFFWC
jgi:hypothetical protein